MGFALVVKSAKERGRVSGAGWCGFARWEKPQGCAGSALRYRLSYGQGAKVGVGAWEEEPCRR